MWNQLPAGYGKWNSVYRFHLRWARKGVFSDLLVLHARRHGRGPFEIIDTTHIKVHQDACRHPQDAVARALGKTKGGRNTKLGACVDRRGKALALVLRPGNEHDSKFAAGLVGNIRGAIVLADKGYDCDALRDHIHAGGGVANIPGRKGRKEEVFYLLELGMDRHLVENFFVRIKRHLRNNTL